jgi:F-type H+-transporting ATPase subunit b|tara:strand:+ start:4724 stop:5308 length:585 start_codon:yes stop_codon:yes gene_type:complete
LFSLLLNDDDMLQELPLFIAAAEAGHDSGGLVGTFGLDAKIIIAQGINFLLVAFLLWKFAFKPVMATMAEREEKISQGLADAEKAKQQLESAEQEKATKLQEANISAQAIVTEARTQAEEVAVKQKEQLDLDLADKRRRAEESIELEREKVLNEARADIARLVVLTSGKVLKKELSDEEKTRLNSAAAREMSAN